MPIVQNVFDLLPLLTVVPLERCTRDTMQPAFTIAIVEIKSDSTKVTNATYQVRCASTLEQYRNDNPQRDYPLLGYRSRRKSRPKRRVY